MQNNWTDFHINQNNLQIEVQVHTEIYVSIYPLYKKYAQRALEIHEGRNRTCFILRNNIVVKLPRCDLGCHDNDWEGSISNGSNRDDGISIQYPKTRLAYYNDIPILFMQQVSYLSANEHRTLEKKFQWIMSVDGGQVGFTRRKRLVAYDYGPY